MALNFTKKQRRILRQAVKRMDLPCTDYRRTVCETNAIVRRRLDRAVAGKIGIIIDGRDCDCVAYHREYVRDCWSSVAAFKRWNDERYDSLDGPETCELVAPGEVTPCYRSVDLALEAYENGHPGTIYARSA